MGVWLLVERAAVTLGAIAAYVVLVVTGHGAAQYSAPLATLLGVAGTAWFANSQAATVKAAQVAQAAQAAQAAPAALAAPAAPVKTPAGGGPVSE